MDKQTIVDLPVELICLILHQVSDKKSLLSLAFSSRKVYEVYLMAQKELHTGLLTRKYEEISLDINEAIAAVRSTGLGMKKNKEKAIAVLDDWRRRQETSTKTKRSLCIEEIKELYKFHKEVLFFLDDFETNADVPFWASSEYWDKNKLQELPVRLTDNEKRRYATGLCRLVIHANIFGKNEGATGFVPSADDNDWEKVISAVDAWRLFFGAMPPWEYEEMGCVWEHILNGWVCVLWDAYIYQKKMIGDDETSPLKNYEETSVDDHSLRDVGGSPFRKFTSQEFEIPPEGVICAGEMILGLTELSRYGPYFFGSFGPRLLFRVKHARPLVQHKMLLSNVSAKVFDSWDVEHATQVPRNLRLPLVYPADKYNVGSLDELWQKTSATEGPTTVWRRTAERLFFEYQDFESAFLKGAGFFEHEPSACWEMHAFIWDEEKLNKWSLLQENDWFEEFWELYS